MIDLNSLRTITSNDLLRMSATIKDAMAETESRISNPRKKSSSKKSSSRKTTPKKTSSTQVKIKNLEHKVVKKNPMNKLADALNSTLKKICRGFDDKFGGKMKTADTILSYSCSKGAPFSLKIQMENLGDDVFYVIQAKANGGKNPQVIDAEGYIREGELTSDLQFIFNELMPSQSKKNPKKR